MIQKIVAVPFLSALFIVFGLAQMFLQPLLADELMNISDVKDCQGIRGDAERLACYDTVSRGGIFNEQQLKQVQVEQFGSSKMPKAPEPAPEPVVTKQPETATAAAVAPQQAVPIPRTTSVDRLDVTVVRIKKDKTGIHYYQTSDGQVWKQQNASSWGLEVPFEAKIEKGVMGSFFLVNEGGKSTRVKRVK